MFRASRILIGLALAATTTAQAQRLDTAMTYQGRLEFGGELADGRYDLAFRLYPAKDALFPIGEGVWYNDILIEDGLVSVLLDFGDLFDGSERWLQISVRPGAETGAYTSLSPRQPLTTAPAAMNLRLPFEASAAGDHLVDVTQTGAAGRAGSFVIDNTGSPHIALYGETTGSGHAVEGHSRGSAKAVGGYSNGSAGEAGYFKVGSAANGAAAVHAETQGAGPALYARSVGGTAINAIAPSNRPALRIDGGYIEVQGAGVGTSTPAFIHQVTTGSRWSTESGSTISHPLCDGDPNAILIVTPRKIWGDPIAHPPVGVIWNPSGNNKWAIYATDHSEMMVGSLYNIIVIKQ